MDFLDIISTYIIRKLLKIEDRVSDMAQYENILATKPDDLSSISRTHSLEGEEN